MATAIFLMMAAVVLSSPMIALLVMLRAKTPVPCPELAQAAQSGVAELSVLALALVALRRFQSERSTR